MNETPETKSPEELAAEKEALLRRYKALKAKQDYADNDCDRGFFAEERTTLAAQIKALARQIDALGEG